MTDHSERESALAPYVRGFGCLYLVTFKEPQIWCYVALLKNELSQFIPVYVLCLTKHV